MAASLSPQEELNRIKGDTTFAGGTYYGRTPGGIADLSTGGIVPGTESVIANSPVRRYTPYTAPTSETYDTERAKLLKENAENAPETDENTIREQMRQRVQEQIDTIKNHIDELPQQQHFPLIDSQTNTATVIYTNRAQKLNV